MEFDQLTVVLLVRGENAPDLTEEEERALQDAHLAYLANLHQAGHLVAAGPLRDPDTYYRGLSMLTVGVDEARALAEADPAVRAGKFRAVVLPWMVPSGALRFTPTKFPHSIAEASSSG
jgi:uncharacterized protein YciI